MFEFILKDYHYRLEKTLKKSIFIQFWGSK